MTVTTPKSPLTSALKLYQVASRITGTLLMLLVAEMITRYGLGYDLWAFGPQGVLAFVPHSDVAGAMPTSGLNLSTGILVVQLFLRWHAAY